MHESASEGLPPSDFLGGVSAQERRDLDGLGHVRTIGRGRHVFQPGAPGQHIYILVAGRAKIYKVSETGREVILWFCFPGEIFGLAEVWENRPREAYAQVCSESRVHAIPREEFMNFLARHPDTARQVIDLLSCRLRVLGEMLLNLVTDDVTCRVIKLVLRMCARYGACRDAQVTLDLPLTHQEIADMVGTTRQTVNTVLNELKRKGLLTINGRRIEVRQRDLLERLASHLPGTETVDEVPFARQDLA